MRRILKVATSLVAPAIVGGIIFLAAGRVDLPMVWGLLGIVTLFAALMLARMDPGLLRERFRPGPGNRDRLTRPLVLVLLLSHWVVAGLDIGRFHWSPIPWGLQVVGLVGYAGSMALVLWAVGTNPFYSSVVRLQADRGQRPVTSGPYRFVRHPGYTGTALGMVCGGLALGSWAAMLPVVGVVALFVRRTLVEDRMLRRELTGYADYARCVRYRLVAGVF